jgi:adenine-specific DNA-methyltransferase
MAHEKLRPDYLFDEEKIAQLKQLAPECFEDGKINFETLRENLGDWTQNEDDPELEHFGLFWPGKRDARRAAAIPPEGTLEPVWGDGLKADGTPDTDGLNDSKNIFIEGENLEVLKLLQKSYANKVKMIYIDPPYNTGNDFVYDDDFTEPLQEYLRRTGQVDEEGKAMTSNKRSDGRFHSKWLSMMYPRLRLARNLLREDGVIFVSIDDNEVHNLRAVLNEIYGEENFIANIIWQKKYSPQNDATYFSAMHDHILCFANNAKSTKGDLLGWNLNLLPRGEAQNKYYKYDDNDGRGLWRSDNVLVKSFSKSGVFPIKNPNTGEDFWPSEGSCYRFNQETAKRLLSENRFYFGKEGKGAPQLKRYLSEVQQGVVPSTIWFREEVGDNQEAAKEVKDLFEVSPFDTPKPTRLISKIIQLSCEEDDIVLDFFAGSATTGHSVLKYNVEKKLNLKYILVQIPEPLETEKTALESWKHLAQVSSQRMRNSIKQFEDFDIDKGFKYSKLKPSNYKSWKNYQGSSTQDLEHQLDMFNQNPLREGYTKDGLLSEVMLLEGFTLCSDISTLTEIETNSIKKITSEYCQHSLLVCLDETIQKETIANLHLRDADIFICLDSAVSTEDKLRLSDKGLIKTI